MKESFGEREIEAHFQQRRLRSLQNVSVAILVSNLMYLALHVCLILMGLMTQVYMETYVFLFVSSALAVWVLWRTRTRNRIGRVELIAFFVVMTLTSYFYTLNAFAYHTLGIAWMLSLVFLSYAYPLPYTRAALWIVPSFVGFLILDCWYHLITRSDVLNFLSYLFGGIFFLPVAFFMSDELYRSHRKYIQELLQNRRNLTFKSQVLAVLGHDLRNSLGSGQNLCAWLLNRWDHYSDADKKHDLSQLYQNLDQSYGLLESIVLWAKSRSGVNALDIDDFLPTGILQKIRELWKDLLLQKAISLEIEAQARSLQWDPMLYEIVLRNLVHNAIKNSPPNGTVRIRVERDNGNWYTSVEDDGPGFPAAILSAARADDPKLPTAGLGLGLMRELLESTGAHLELENKPTGGARVRLVYGPPHSRAS